MDDLTVSKSLDDLHARVAMEFEAPISYFVNRVDLEPLLVMVSELFSSNTRLAFSIRSKRIVIANDVATDFASAYVRLPAIMVEPCALGKGDAPIVMFQRESFRAQINYISDW